MLRLCYNCKNFTVTEDSYGYYGENDPGEIKCRLGIQGSLDLSDWDISADSLRDFLETGLECKEFEEV